MPEASDPAKNQTLRAAATIAWYALAFGSLFVVAMVVSALGTIDNALLLLFTRLAALFGILGAMYGSIIALDPTAPRVLAPWSWVHQVSAPRTRTLTCAALGAVAVWTASEFSSTGSSPAWYVLGFATGALLGWKGWSWARHIDF